MAVEERQFRGKCVFFSGVTGQQHEGFDFVATDGYRRNRKRGRGVQVVPVPERGDATRRRREPAFGDAEALSGVSSRVSLEEEGESAR